MKKVTMIFLVSDEVATEVENELAWCNYENAVKYMHENGKETSCFVEDAGDRFFTISSLHRDDLEAAGFDASSVDDATMEHIAQKMGDDYVTQLFWEHLPIFAEYEGIPLIDKDE